MRGGVLIPLFKKAASGLAASALVASGMIAFNVATAIPAHANPPTSSVSEFQPNVPTKFGGRTTAIDVYPTNTMEAVAGTESGGLFKTTDGGNDWTHLDGLIPFRINDVKYSDDGSVLLATTNPNADNSYPGGIWRSTDDGSTWSQPATAAGLCGGNTTANAIAFEGGSNEVYAGVACGLAYSSDLGATWSLLPMAQVGPVVAPSASEIDLCATDGFHRFSRSGSTLTQQVSSSPGGFNNCDVTHDLAVAPQETSVIYTLAGPAPFNLYESDDNGSTWNQVDSGLDGGTRQSLFVGTHVAPGGGNNFTIIYGASLGGPYLGSCIANVSGTRCANLPISRTTINVAHSDQNEVVFRTDSSNCAQYISSDGGVQTTTDCGKNFVMAAGSGSTNGGFNALQVYDLTGQTHPGLATDLFFGTQDNNAYGSTDGGSTWAGHSCCDAYDISVLHSAPNNSNEVATFDETGGKGQAAASPGLLQDQSWPNPPQTCISAGSCQYQNPWVIGPGKWVQAVNPGNGQWFFWVATVTGTVPSISVSWSGPATDSHGNPFSATGLDWRPRIVGPASDPILFIGQNNGTTNDILKITGLLSNTMTGTVLSGTGTNRLYNLAGYGDNFVFTDSFAVDPGNSDHLIAYDAGDGEMKITTDGGLNWIANQQLTNLLGGAGRYCPGCELAAGQSESRAIRFDPTNPNVILVGTDNAGIIASVDGGNTWTQMLGSPRVTDITDFFFDEVHNDILVSSYGRGLWSLDMTQRAATVVYTGDTSDDYNDSATLSAQLYDSNNGPSSPIVGAKVNLALGSQSCSGFTDSAGNVSCVIPTITQDAGSSTVTVTYAGDAQWQAQTTSTAFTITPEDTHLVNYGATTSDYHDPATMDAQLTDPTDGTPIQGKTVQFQIGTSVTDTCSAVTNSTGYASCQIDPTQAAGAYTMTASFAGDTDYAATSATQPFTITKEETTTTYTGPTVILQGASGATLSGKLLEDGNSAVPIVGRTLTLGLGGQHCSGTTDATGTASCSITFTGALGPQPLSAVFAGDAYYLPSSDTSKVAIVFAFPSRGAFSLGDVTVGAASPSSTLTWWDAKWGSSNSLSGGDAPAAFKGFASTVSLPSTSPATSCNAPWTTTPGNSSSPPGTVPSYMGVIVTDRVAKSGSTTSGTTIHIVVVKVDSGYAPNPGHSGTGTLVATFC